MESSKINSSTLTGYTFIFFLLSVFFQIALLYQGRIHESNFAEFFARTAIGSAPSSVYSLVCAFLMAVFLILYIASLNKSYKIKQ